MATPGVGPEELSLLAAFFAVWLGLPAWWVRRDAARHGMAARPWFVLALFAGPVALPPYLAARKRRFRDGLAREPTAATDRMK